MRPSLGLDYRKHTEITEPFLSEALMKANHNLSLDLTTVCAASAKRTSTARS